MAGSARKMRLAAHLLRHFRILLFLCFFTSFGKEYVFNYQCGIHAEADRSTHFDSEALRESQHAPFTFSRMVHAVLNLYVFSSVARIDVAIFQRNSEGHIFLTRWSVRVLDPRTQVASFVSCGCLVMLGFVGVVDLGGWSCSAMQFCFVDGILWTCVAPYIIGRCLRWPEYIR